MLEHQLHAGTKFLDLTSDVFQQSFRKARLSLVHFSLGSPSAPLNLTNSLVREQKPPVLLTCGSRGVHLKKMVVGLQCSNNWSIKQKTSRLSDTFSPVRKQCGRFRKIQALLMKAFVCHFTHNKLLQNRYLQKILFCSVMKRFTINHSQTLVLCYCSDP